MTMKDKGRPATSDTKHEADNAALTVPSEYEKVGWNEKIEKAKEARLEGIAARQGKNPSFNSSRALGHHGKLRI